MCFVIWYPVPAIIKSMLRLLKSRGNLYIEYRWNSKNESSLAYMGFDKLLRKRGNGVYTCFRHTYSAPFIWWPVFDKVRAHCKHCVYNTRLIVIAVFNKHFTNWHIIIIDVFPDWDADRIFTHTHTRARTRRYSHFPSQVMLYIQYLSVVNTGSVSGLLVQTYLR